MQKCPHGVPTTPSRKTGPQIGDVFMWRDGEERDELASPLDFDSGNVIKVWGRRYLKKNEEKADGQRQ
jgi:hypothetical protein